MKDDLSRTIYHCRKLLEEMEQVIDSSKLTETEVLTKLADLGEQLTDMATIVEA